MIKFDRILGVKKTCSADGLFVCEGMKLADPETNSEGRKRGLSRSFGWYVVDGKDEVGPPHFLGVTYRGPRGPIVVNYCPWCGARLSKSSPIEQASSQESSEAPLPPKEPGEDKIDDREYAKLLFLVEALAHSSSRFEKLVQMTREAPVAPSPAFERRLAILQTRFEASDAKDDVKDDAKGDAARVREIANDLRSSTNCIERGLGHMLARAAGLVSPDDPGAWDLGEQNGRWGVI